MSLMSFPKCRDEPERPSKQLSEPKPESEPERRSGQTSPNRPNTRVQPLPSPSPRTQHATQPIPSRSDKYPLHTESEPQSSSGRGRRLQTGPARVSTYFSGVYSVVADLPAGYFGRGGGSRCDNEYDGRIGVGDWFRGGTRRRHGNGNGDDADNGSVWQDDPVVRDECRSRTIRRRNRRDEWDAGTYHP